uniref:Rad21/Rec8-like protein C-terminal eukaryotic domain-containing protein n=1 Tax=Compsopogon caeruleus TaxID=31354 RepID=A0A7S1XG97_9RHOD
MAKLRSAFRPGQEERATSNRVEGLGLETLDVQVGSYARITMEATGSRHDVDLEMDYGTVRLDDNIHMSLEPMLQVTPTTAFQASVQDITMDRFRMGSGALGAEDFDEDLEVEIPRRRDSEGGHRLELSDIDGAEEDEFVAFTPVARLSQERQKRRLSQGFEVQDDDPMEPLNVPQALEQTTERPLDEELPVEIARRTAEEPPQLEIEVPLTPVQVRLPEDELEAHMELDVGADVMAVELPHETRARTSDATFGEITPISRNQAELDELEVPTPIAAPGRPMLKKRKRILHDEETILTNLEIRGHLEDTRTLRRVRTPQRTEASTPALGTTSFEEDLIVASLPPRIGDDLISIWKMADDPTPLLEMPNLELNQPIAISTPSPRSEVRDPDAAPEDTGSPSPQLRTILTAQSESPPAIQMEATTSVPVPEVEGEVRIPHVDVEFDAPELEILPMIEQDPRAPQETANRGTLVSLREVALTKAQVDEAVEEDRPSALNRRTLKMYQLIESEFGGSEDLSSSINIKAMAAQEGVDRRTAARVFYELLVLSNRKLVHLNQVEPYGDILVSRTEQFANVRKSEGN